jgi:hypothetical protein
MNLLDFSPHALAINGAAEAIATLAVLGFLGASTIVTITCKEWKNYDEKKHLQKIQQVNKLCKKHLQDLMITGGPAVKGFPLVFEFTEDGKKVNSLHYTDEEVEDIGAVLPNTAVELAPYRHKVLDALLKLKEYYFDLSKNDDITRGVVSYLMNYIQNRCLSFSGYRYDITYLKALIAFITAYASEENTENSQHFSRLKEVYSSLKFALQDLEKHQETLSLRALVDETRESCLAESDRLYRLFIKMVIPEEHQKIISTVTYDELKNDVLRKKYVDIEIWGIPIINKTKVKPSNKDVIFHRWILELAAYYLESENPRAMLHGKPIILPEEFFTFIKKAKNIQQQVKPTKEDAKFLETQLNLIKNVFRSAPNFINTKLDTSSDAPKFVLISTDDELLDAAETIANFAHLIHGLISLQALCAELSTGIERLGLDFFDDQANFHEIFSALDTLFNVVQSDLHLIHKKMTDIAIANKNTLRLANKIEFEAAVNQSLEGIDLQVLELTKQVKAYKNKHPETPDATKKEILSAGAFFQRLYGVLPPDGSAPVPPAEDNSADTPPDIEFPKEDKTMPVPGSVEEKEMELNDLSADLTMAISAIQKERNPDLHIKEYNAISTQLRLLKIKSINMLAERNQTPDRANKANKLYQLTYDLYQKTIDYLSQAPTHRAEELNQYIQMIDTQLNGVENRAFIERHDSSVTKFLSENLGLFKTAAQSRLNSFQQTCHQLEGSAPGPQ